MDWLLQFLEEKGIRDKFNIREDMIWALNIDLIYINDYEYKINIFMFGNVIEGNIRKYGDLIEIFLDECSYTLDVDDETLSEKPDKKILEAFNINFEFIAETSNI